jgi:hypothetical protein
MDEITFINYVVTCHTQDCGNSEITISIAAPSVDPYFVCGVCSKEITDFKEI